jgi:hypothetical protein
MRQEGAPTRLCEIREPTLSLEPCGARGLAWLMEQHGDAKLTDLLPTLADCPKARSAKRHRKPRVFAALNLPPHR